MLAADCVGWGKVCGEGACMAHSLPLFWWVVGDALVYEGVGRFRFEMLCFRKGFTL